MENRELTNNESLETNEKKKMSWWKKTLLITGSTIGGIISLFLAFILVLNVGKFGIYHNYYTIREVVCTNHGMNDNYVSQGTAVTDDGKYVITSGYMSDKTHSRIYITNIATDETKYVKFTRNGEKNTYHFGGVAVSGDTLYLASASKIFPISLEDCFTKDVIDLGEGIKTNNSASFIFADGSYLYVGEFFDGNSNKTDNHIEYNNVEYNAITTVYEIDDLTKPVKVIGIRDKVQGFAVSTAGGILLSTSFGLTSSKFYYYKESNIVNTNTTYNDIPLYVLENHNLLFEGPAMAEDLDYHDGKFYTNFESSCNKYFFGKLFVSTDKIVALEVEELLA